MNHIAIISGTNRENNRSLQIATHLAEIYHSLEAPTKVLDLSLLPEDIFRPSAYATKPASFDPWAKTILGADGVLMVIPEYNGSFPGILKYFIDLLPFPEAFEERPVAFVGIAGGSWGALRAVEHMQGVVGYRNAHVFPGRVFLPTVGIHFSPDGKLTKDLEDRLQRQAEGFLKFIRRLQA